MDLSPERVGAKVAWMTTHRYAVLFGALVFGLVTTPAVDAVITGHWPPAIIAAKAMHWVLLIFACILAVGRGRAVVALGLAVLLGAVFEGIDALWPGAQIAEVGKAIFLCSLIGWALAHLVRRTFAARVVESSNLHAAAAIYLLLGFAFASAYHLVHALDPGAFRFPGDSAAQKHTFLYFSFVTLTTMGYGDITPVSDVARMLAIVEAIAGQIYLVVSVSRLVGLYVAQKTDRGGG